MKPEEKARIKIDQWLEEAGWKVVDRDQYEANCTAVAVREALLKGKKEADYFFFIGGKAIALLEAKREEADPSGKAMEQAKGYATKVPSYYPAYQKTIPFLFTSNGKEHYFCDFRDEAAGKTSPSSPAPGYEPIVRMLRPKELVSKLGIKDEFAGLPVLNPKGLRACQFEAVTNLEDSFRQGQRRALMVLATGAGKTYTACTAAYRMLAYTPMRRVLFLVDRNNLGKQAYDEFGKYRLTESGETFSNTYVVERLHSAKIPQECSVVISTIQRLFAFLKGEPIDDFDEESNDVVVDGDSEKKIVLPENPLLPSDYFDLIIIDECHRSIYGNWSSVLDYFSSARLIGLTATPIPETKAFFNYNIVVNYTLEQSIIDGVNVGHRTYRIKTRETEEGGAIREGDQLRHTTCYTGQVEDVRSKEARNYSKTELNHSIINPAQIKLILETYRDAVYTEMFTDPQREPNFDFLPKTLIFALNEQHANNIVKIGREVFGRENDEHFIQKITYSAGDSNQLIKSFRLDKDFRIAVTCTLVATGTDVKPLEVVMFMRDVESLPLYTQMKGRGVRTIGDDALRNVTPNAHSKDCFYLVDCVGVEGHEHSVPKPGEEPKHVISLKELLEKITLGYVPDDYLQILANRLARTHNKANLEQRDKFSELAGLGMAEIAKNIFDALGENGDLPPFLDVNEPNNERRALVAPLANHAEARKYLLILVAGFVDTLMPGTDELLDKGFNHEEALSTTRDFEKFCQENADSIEALRIIYNHTGERLTISLLTDLQNQLKMASSAFTTRNLWQSYHLVRRDDVVPATKKEEIDALTSLIQLVRFAYGQTPKLESVIATATQFFNLWVGHCQKNYGMTQGQADIMRQLVDFIAFNGDCTLKDVRTFDQDVAVQVSVAYGGAKPANQALHSMFHFVVFRKTA